MTAARIDDTRNPNAGNRRALVALERRSRALEAVLRLRGLECVTCSPGEVRERTAAVRPVLVVQDPLAAEGQGWADLYSWKRDSRLAQAAVLLVRQQGERESAPFGGADVLARPFGRSDVGSRVRALLAGQGQVRKALLAESAPDDARGLSVALAEAGIEVVACRYGEELAAALVSAGGHMAFLPLVFDGKTAAEWLATVPAGTPRPALVMLMGPEDPGAADAPVLTRWLDAAPATPLAETLDAVVASVLRACDALEVAGERTVLPFRAFQAVLQRTADYAQRYARRFVLLQAGFEEPAEGEERPSDDDWMEFAQILAQRFRFHDVVAWSPGTAVYALLVESGQEQVAMFRDEVVEPGRKDLMLRVGRPLPAVTCRAVAFPEAGVASEALLAALDRQPAPRP
jgi:DNA-binding response OmpR family regulator